MSFKKFFSRTVGWLVRETSESASDPSEYLFGQDLEASKGEVKKHLNKEKPQSFVPAGFHPVPEGYIQNRDSYNAGEVLNNVKPPENLLGNENGSGKGESPGCGKDIKGEGKVIREGECEMLKFSSRPENLFNEHTVHTGEGKKNTQGDRGDFDTKVETVQSRSGDGDPLNAVDSVEECEMEPAKNSYGGAALGSEVKNNVGNGENVGDEEKNLQKPEKGDTLNKLEEAKRIRNSTNAWDLRTRVMIKSFSATSRREINKEEEVIEKKDEISEVDESFGEGGPDAGEEDVNRLDYL